MAPNSSPRRVVVAVDVDEVLCKYSEGFFKWQAARDGSEEPPPAPGICFKLACNKGNAAAREEFALSQAFVEIDCIPGAKQALKRLRKAGARFEVVTSRPLSMKEATLKYLKKYYDGLIDEVHFSPSGQKGKICKEIGAEVLIDDQARNISDAAKEDVPGVLFDLFGTYTWSQAATLPGIAVRKRTWEEVSNYLMHRLSLNTTKREGSDVSSHDDPLKDKALFGSNSTNTPAATAEATREEEAVSVEEPDSEGQQPLFWSSSPEMKAKASLNLLLPTRIPHPPTTDPSPQPPLLHLVETASETETTEDDCPATPPPEPCNTTTTAAHTLFLSVVNNDGEEFRESEPLLSGYVWKKGKQKSLRLARLIGGTPLQGLCWHKRYFQIGPGQTMSYWRTQDCRDEPPLGRVNLYDSTELRLSGKELLIDLDTIEHRWFVLRCATTDAARRWAEACQAAAGAGSALYEQYLAQKRSSFVTNGTDHSVSTAGGPQSAEALLHEALASEQKST